jgi:hypothetical protein
MHMEACMASELITTRNEFGKLSDTDDIPDWDAHIEAPNLEASVFAVNFRTPKKVQVIAATKKEVIEDFVEVVEIGTVSPLNVALPALTPLEGPKKTPGIVALCRILFK